MATVTPSAITASARGAVPSATCRPDRTILLALRMAACGGPPALTVERRCDEQGTVVDGHLDGRCQRQRMWVDGPLRVVPTV
ncbi:MAG: hypothetical protein ACYDCB_11920, partial [Candidatus Dormibacteria bacterium]